MQTYVHTEAAARFALIELDGVPTTTPTVDVQAASSVATVASKDEEVNALAANLAEREVFVATEHGFAVEDVNDGTFYSAGTRLWDIGEAALAARAEQYELLPTLGHAAAAHSDTIAAERREERVDHIGAYRLDADGRLREVARDADGPIAFGPRAIDLAEQGFKQLVQLAPEGTACKTNVNRWLALPDADRDARFRIRTRHGRREVFAVFPQSERGYVPFDGDRVLFEAARIAPDLKCELNYDELTTRLRARCIAQAPIDVPAFTGVGRVHRIGFDLVAADNGTSAIHCRVVSSS